jgi:hypothetical protein
MWSNKLHSLYGGVKHVVLYSTFCLHRTSSHFVVRLNEKVCEHPSSASDILYVLQLVSRIAWRRMVKWTDNNDYEWVEVVQGIRNGVSQDIILHLITSKENLK